MKVYAVMEYVPAGTVIDFDGEKEFSIEQLCTVFVSPRKALKYIQNNPCKYGNSSSYKINAFNAETGDLLGFAEYQFDEENGRLKRLK